MMIHFMLFRFGILSFTSLVYLWISAAYGNLDQRIVGMKQLINSFSSVKNLVVSWLVVDKLAVFLFQWCHLGEYIHALIFEYPGRVEMKDANSIQQHIHC